MCVYKTKNQYQYPKKLVVVLPSMNSENHLITRPKCICHKLRNPLQFELQKSNHKNNRKRKGVGSET